MATKRTTQYTKPSTVKTEEVKEEAVKLVPKAFDINQIVTVRNGFQGKLVYKSSKTGELFVWDEFGDEQDMEVGELRSARSSAKDFFINNWFMFDDPELIDYLGVAQYYRFALTVDQFDEVFSLSDGELAKRLATLSDGQKKSVVYRAKQMIASGEIDSNKKIALLEKYLNVELIEH